MEKKTAEQIWKGDIPEHKHIAILYSKYGYQIDAMSDRIREYGDRRVWEYSSLQSEEKDKQLFHMTQERDNWFEQLGNARNEIERLREACIWAKSVFQKLADEGRYPEFLLAENGGDGIMPITKALSNQPIESDKERLYDLCKKCEGKGVIEWVPSVTNKDTPLRERIAIAVVTPLCKSAVDPEEVSDAVLEEVQPIIEAKDRRIKELEEQLKKAKDDLYDLIFSNTQP